MESITIDQLKENFGLKSINIVDVRNNDETAMGIIPGAKTIPMNEILTI